MSLLKQARLANAQRKRRIDIGPKEDTTPSAESKIIDISVLTNAANEVFKELATTEYPEGANFSDPKVWSTPVKTVLTHVDKTTWKKQCAASVAQYLKEVSNRERYGRWALVGWEILVEERVHNRWIPLGHDRSSLANLAPGQGGFAVGRNMRYREQLGYCVIAMQAVDTIGADKTVWKGGFVSSEQSIGTEIAEALRANNSTNTALEGALEEERTRNARLAEQVAAKHTEIADLKALVAQALAGLQIKQAAVASEEPTSDRAQVAELGAAAEEAPAVERESSPEPAQATAEPPAEAEPPAAAKPKRRTRRRRSSVKAALKDAKDGSDS